MLAFELCLHSKLYHLRKPDSILLSLFICKLRIILYFPSSVWFILDGIIYVQQLTQCMEEGKCPGYSSQKQQSSPISNNQALRNISRKSITYINVSGFFSICFISHLWLGGIIINITIWGLRTNSHWNFRTSK